MNDELPIHKRRVVYEVPGMGSVSVQRDIVYKSVEATDLKLDVYAPKGLSNSARLPGIVFIHGGPIPPPLQLQMKDTGQYLSWGELAAASGLVGVTFNHRYHDYTYLEQANSDVIAAFDYIRKHADGFNLDPDRLCLWVCSGGGPFLSFALQDQPKFVRCIVIYYAILDLRPIERISQVVSGESLEKFSPMAYRGSTEVPMFIVRAGLDNPQLNQTIDLFVQKALAINAPFDFANHAQGHHGFDILDNDARSQQIIARTIEFIKANV